MQEPRLTFEYDGTEMTCTRLQNGETNTQPVTNDPELNAFTVDIDLIGFVDAASWLPFYGPTWRFCKTPLSEVETNGMWIAVQTPGNPDEYVAIHYVIE